MTQKNIDDTHQKLARNSSLQNHFSMVEVDNLVDPDEFHNFEAAMAETMPALPPLSKENRPALRIRRMGKHSSQRQTVNGMYFGGEAHTVALDVHTSGSAVH